MSRTRHEQLSEIFVEASALAPGEREEYLVRSCDGDFGLRREVESLLEHAGNAPPVLDRGAGDVQALYDFIPLPDRIGPYAILEQIDEGGMGVVYRALQEKPFRREVALKLIKPGFETRSVLARFETERHVLALLDHPGIARVHDAGVTPQGRPYFAMELVHGSPITLFCDENRLAVPTRLELFLKVCDAVQHAHRNGVIHRDLKPSNVLVTRLDGDPVPKVIDFGIAKALSGEGRSTGTQTQAGQFVGTPEYISPEQASPSGTPVDIRTDVYSMGALLYEFLVGVPPLGPEMSGESDLARIRSLLRDEDPPAPSARLRSLRDREAGIATARGSTPAALRRSVRGDLDCIVLKALEKDPARRYGSIGELAADVRRYRDHDPIEAKPAGAFYRLGRLARKHTLASALAVALLPLVLAFAVLASFQASRLAQERDRAEDLISFLSRSYEMPLFIAGRHARPGRGEVLARSARLIDDDLANRPLLRARLGHRLGSALRGVGDLDRASVLLDRARALLAGSLGADHEETMAVSADLAQCYSEQGRTVEAERIFLRTLDDQRRVLGPDHPETLRTMMALGVLFKRESRLEEAVALLGESWRGLRAAQGEDHPQALLAAALVASTHMERGAYDRAGTILSEILPRMQEDHPERSIALQNMVRVHAQRGERKQALSMFRRAVEAGYQSDYFGDPFIGILRDDPDFMSLAKGVMLRDALIMGRLEHLGRSFQNQGRYHEAETLYRYLLEMAPETGLESFLYFQGELGQTYLSWGRHLEAVRVFQEHVAELTLSHGEFDERVATTWYTLMQTHLARGEKADALKALDRAEATFRGLEKNPRYGRKWMPYLKACRAALSGDRDAALRHLARAVEGGFPHVDLVREDRALESLRDEPGFSELLATLSRRYDYP